MFYKINHDFNKSFNALPPQAVTFPIKKVTAQLNLSIKMRYTSFTKQLFLKMYLFYV